MKHLTISKELKIANSLYSNAKYKGGHSINAKFEQPKTGYLVSVKDGLIFDNMPSVNEHTVSKWIKDNLSDGAKDCLNYYFGSWVDQETGKVYFDLSLNTPSKLTALHLAEDNNQLAIWDIDNNREIRVKE